MRHICSGEQSHLCEAQRTQKGEVCRCDRNRQKGTEALLSGELMNAIENKHYVNKSYYQGRFRFSRVGD